MPHAAKPLVGRDRVDYRYRGVSLSDEAPAWQAGLTVSRPGGLYGDLHVSTIAAYGGTQDDDGARIEAVLTLGWAGVLGDFAVDAAVATYQYPGASMSPTPKSSSRSARPALR